MKRRTNFGSAWSRPFQANAELWRRSMALTTCLLLGSCGPRTPALLRDDAPQALEQRLLAHVTVLASDEFDGRAPGTPGEARSIEYIARQFAAIGLRSPAGESGFLQSVPLASISSRGDLRGGAVDRPGGLDPARDYAIQTAAPATRLDVARLVFAGYGIVAPEFERDDYAGIDVRDEIVVVLAGEPDGLATHGAASLGSAARTALTADPRTLHRWVWMKQRRARERHARGLLIVVPDEALESRRRFFESESMMPTAAPAWEPPVSVLLAQSAFARMAAEAGIDVTQLRSEASSSRFAARLVPIALRGEASSTATAFTSHNVVGTIAGRTDECVVVTAHWDGYGRDAAASGDGVWNGAVDDAGGVAQLIEISRRLAREGPPRRTMHFVATTGEERGFLGARHFLARGPCAADRISAVVNLDWFYELGAAPRFAHHGLGYSSLDAIFERLAASQGRTVTAVNRYYAGGDQLPFLLAGIPGFHGGSIGPPLGREESYERDFYARRDADAVVLEGNSNEDEPRPEWDLRGAAQDTELLIDAVRELASRPERPCWTGASAFATAERLCR